MEDEILIECLRKYTFIYDTTDKGHANMQLVKNAWEEIAETVGSSVAECKKRWTSLRDQFRRNVIKKKSVSGPGADNRCKWRYEDTLAFLLPHMRERGQKSNLVADNDYTQDDENNQFFEDWDQPHFPNSSLCANPLLSPAPPTSVSSSLASSIAGPQDSSSHNKRTNKPSQQPTTAQVLQNYIALKKAKLEAPTDHIGSFFIAMEATTRRLPPILQIEAKAKIAALLSDLEMRAYVSSEHNTSPLQSNSKGEIQDNKKPSLAQNPPEPKTIFP